MLKGQQQVIGKHTENGILGKAYLGTYVSSFEFKMGSQVEVGNT